MRKALLSVVLCAAIVLAVGAEGAPLFRVTGQLETGAQDVVTMTAAGTSDSISLYDNDIGNPSRFRIGLYFTSPDGNWGLTARLDNETLLNAGTLSAAWNQALAWGMIFDRHVTVKAGLLDEEAFSFTWKPFGAEIIWGDEFDGTLGAEIQVRPVDGLQVGWILPIVHGSTMLETLESSYAAVSYALPGILRVVAGLELSPSYTTYAWVGADILAVKDLTARVAAQALNINNSYLRWLELFQEAGYPFGDVLVGLKGWEELYAVPNSSVAWQVEPSVSYRFGYFTFTVLGDVGTLIALDPNPGVPSLPFGIAAGASAAYTPIPTITMRMGALYKMGDIMVQNAAVQFFVNFQWLF